MDSIGFKKNITSSQENYDGIVIPSYQTEEETLTTTDYDKIKRVYAVYKKWTIKFGILTATQQDYLEELAFEEAPQFIYNSVTYNVMVTSLDNGFNGAKMIIVSREPES